MEIKLIALDLDGTLLDADHATIPPKNLEALRAAADRGVHLAIASGRSWSLVRETARALGPVRYGITANGAYVLDTASGKAVGQTGMDPAQCARIIRILRRYNLPYELYIDGDNYVERSDVNRLGDYALSQDFLEMFSRQMTVTDDMIQALDCGVPEKFNLFWQPETAGDRAALMADLEATGPLFFAGALGSNLEFNAAGVSKGKALVDLCASLGYTPGEVMAFGDADNDLEMLSWAGWSFAMENGSDAVKEAANYLAPANSEAGVGQMVERYVLNRA